MTEKRNCWEIKKCGREPNGTRVNELGICPVAREERLDGVHGGKHAGRACWPVAGTFCGGVTQGTFASKIKNCLDCECYKSVVQEEGLNLQTTKEILNSLHNKILTVGLPLLIKNSRGEDAVTYLAGWKADEYLIAQLPSLNSATMASKTRYSLKYIKDGDAYIFDTEAVSVQTFPFPVVYFKYPQAINKVPLRKSKRFLTRIPSRIKAVDEEGDAFEVLITDIGEGGCRIKAIVQPGMEITNDTGYAITFNFLGISLENVEGKVRNVYTSDNLHFLGMEFQGLSQEAANKLVEMLDLLDTFQVSTAAFL